MWKRKLLNSYLIWRILGSARTRLRLSGTKEDAMSSKEEKMLGSRDVKSSSLKGRLLTTTMTPGTT
jgi:hypothetical protein